MRKGDCSTKEERDIEQTANGTHLVSEDHGHAVLEHADADPDNPFNWSTWYRTGPVTRLLFFWDSGDCHVIHHIYPRLPFYNMSRAVRLMEPVMTAAGVVQRHSFLQMLKGWFIDNHPHRSQWPMDGRPNQSRPLTSSS